MLNRLSVTRNLLHLTGPHGPAVRTRCPAITTSLLCREISVHRKQTFSDLHFLHKYIFDHGTKQNSCVSIPFRILCLQVSYIKMEGSKWNVQNYDFVIYLAWVWFLIYHILRRTVCWETCLNVNERMIKKGMWDRWGRVARMVKLEMPTKFFRLSCLIDRSSRYRDTTGLILMIINTEWL
jgi:hypothetical protein